MVKIKKIIFIIFLFFSFNFLYALSYKAKFIGLKDKEIIKSIENSTDIFLLKDRPPRTINALRYRIESDLPTVVKTFYAYGYFDATVTYDIEEETNMVNVYIFCDPGPRYMLHSYEVCTFPCNEKCTKFELDLEKLDLKLDEGTNSNKLLNAKAELLKFMSALGYPLAKIEKYEAIADGIKKIIDIKICINTGPKCNFGPISISGLKDIYPKYILKKINWEEKELYNPEKIKETQDRLTQSGLFSSVSITHGERPDEENNLPIKIQVIESNHQNVQAGINYATADGPGCLFSYTNYNIGNMGEIINLHGEIAKKALTGYISYKKPDFIWFEQDFFLSAYALRERIRAYNSFTYGSLARIVHRTSKNFHYAYGIKGEHVEVSKSANNGRYLLIGLPAYLRLNSTNHLLNPTQGFCLIYTATPYFNLDEDFSPFFKQTLATNFYIPVKKNEKIVFATRIQFGSIIGQSVYKIPMTKLFLGGCEDDLRGYRYKTVGPRNSNGDIIGGRSAIYFTFEPRLRISKNFGIVPFFDMGNIKKTSLPSVTGRWRKSYGIGIRYFTFLGPLRMDIAFPLDKYKKGDPSYRIYVSIGQTF